ncbi:hypothetical protein WEH80_01000 [Actinomycetes bacterium KLBMP 9759]
MGTRAVAGVAGVAGVVAAACVVGAVAAGVAANPLGDPRATTALVASAVGGLALGARSLRRRATVVPHDPDAPEGTTRIRFSGAHAALSTLAAVAVGIALLSAGAALQHVVPAVAGPVLLAGGVLVVAGAATARRVRRPGELRLDPAGVAVLGVGPPTVVPWAEITQVRRSGYALELVLRSERPASSALRRHLGEPRVTVPCRRIDVDPVAVEELVRKALLNAQDDHR